MHSMVHLPARTWDQVKGGDILRSARSEYSSENSSDLLIACYSQLRTGNDNPYWIDYQGCEHPLTILYFLDLRLGSYMSTKKVKPLLPQCFYPQDGFTAEPASTVQ
jgi:hypothetical protein